MKKMFLFMVLSTLVFAKDTSVVIEVQGMTCPLCTTAIKKSLKSLEGVSSAKVYLNTKQATVVFDDEKLKVENLLEAIKNTGYSGSVVSY